MLGVRIMNIMKVKPTGAMLEPRFKAVGIAHVYYFDGKTNIHFWVEELALM